MFINKIQILHINCLSGKDQNFQYSTFFSSFFEGIIVRLILYFIILVFLISCGPIDGTFTIRLEGADDYNGCFVWFNLTDGNNEWSGDALNWQSDEPIINGIVESSVRDPNTDHLIIFPAQQIRSYDMFIDVDGSGSIGNIGDYQSETFSFQIDSDIVVEFFYPDNFSLIQ